MSNQKAITFCTVCKFPISATNKEAIIVGKKPGCSNACAAIIELKQQPGTC